MKSPPPEQIETEPANSTEAVTPAPETPNLPPGPEPVIPEPAPVVVNEPEPIITEPELKIWTCDEFPSLPLEPAPSEEIVHILTANEATHFWKSLSCPWSPFNELGEISGCERLLAGTFTNAYDKYYSVFKFSLTDLPAADEIEDVTLNLYPLQGSVFFVVTLGLDIRPLATDWWRECSNETETWRPLCDYETPATIIDETIDWELGNDEEGYYLLRLEFTELYRRWQTGTQPNHGLMIHSVAGLFNFFIFAGPDHPDPSYRPHLKFTAKAVEPTLYFPLAGVYDESRITGYDFGKWWRKQFCPDDKTPLRHTGIDLEAAPGDPVYAVMDGEITYASLSDKWGGYVVTTHDGKWDSTCTHVIPEVMKGQLVKRGDQIATVAPGNDNFNPHLHLQIRLAPHDLRLALIGRLPNESCVDPAFPEKFIDPKCLDWGK